MEIKLKHIVYVSREFRPSFQAGGIASYVKEAGEAFVRLGIKVTVICASDDTCRSDCYVENGVNIIRLAGGDFYLSQTEKNPLFIKNVRFIYRFFPYRYQLKRVIQGLEDVSLIEVTEYGAEGLFLQNLNIPLVLRLHTPYLLDRKTEKVRQFNFNTFHYYWIGLLEFYIIKKAKYVTSCSESLKTWTIEKFNIPKHKITTIYNPLNLTNWSLSKNNFNIVKQPFIVFFSGRIQYEKGVVELIDAVKLLRKKGVNIIVQLAGKIGKLPPLLVDALNNNTWDWCQFLGQLPRESLQNHYSRATLSCFPSWWENMPYTCLEAMSVGSLVLCSSSGGMTEVIKDGENGFLCPPRNSEKLAGKIENILNISFNEKQVITQNAIRTIENNFSSSLITSKSLDFYTSILA